MKYLVTFSLVFTTVLAAFCQSSKHLTGELIVQLKPGQEIRQTVAKLSELEGKPTQFQILKNISPPLRIWLLQFDHLHINEERLLFAVRSLPEVQEAQFNHFLHLRETTPDDANFGSQWQWVNTGQGGGTPDADVDADLAWDITTGGTTATGQDIVVCVVEGTNRNHPDLQGNLWVNNAEVPGNGLDDDGNGYVDDYNGWNINNDTDQIPAEQHGTQVAGMIGAKGNNGIFTTGINWDVKIMNVEFSGVNEANVIESYTYPYVQRKRFNQTNGAQGAFVVATNSSWGIDGGDPADSPLWCAFYDSLGMEGILSCGSTANNNVNIDVVLDLPTACTSEYMVAVTATNNKDVRTFSGYGTTHIDVAAPGGAIVTLGTNGGPSTTSGTSFSSPLTAGIIALLYSAPCSNLAEQALSNPAETAILVRDALFQGVDIVPNLVNETKYGGRVNAFNSLNILLQSCGPCPKPYSIQIGNIIDTSVALTWSSSDSTQTSQVRYKAVGTMDWTLLGNVSSPLTLTGLQGCTDYEFQLQDLCSTDSSGFSTSFFFKTEGCCVPPANLAVNNFTQGQAQVTWEPVFAANGYNLQVISGSETTIYSLNDPNFLLTGLNPCTEYQVAIQTVCDTGATDFSEPISFITPGCGSCVDLSYCAVAGQSTDYEWIESVSLANLNNISGDNQGYGDFTGISTDLVTYSSNTLTITPGFATSAYPEWYSAWIDFNQDGDFLDATEKVYDSGNTVTTAATGQVNIPGDAEIGLTRMRIVMRWNAAPSGPCANFNNGEVEDYCVNIVQGTPPFCAVPASISVNDTTTTTAELNWENIANANSYSVRYRPSGASDWSTTDVTPNNVLLSQLDFCKSYEMQVRSNCTDISSDFSNSTFFTTSCVNAVNENAGLGDYLVVSNNPSNGHIEITLESKHNQMVEFQVTDVSGRRLFEQEMTLTMGRQTVKLNPELASGLYFLIIKTARGQVVRKIVRA